MSSPRLRRLAADYEAIKTRFAGHPYITVYPVGAMPPERYQIEYRVPGLIQQGNQKLGSSVHRVEIRLLTGYPREQPYCIPLTEIFHPNVAQHYCIADYWFASTSLADIIGKIGNMIQYKIYEPKSPLNATAGFWAEQNPSLFPLHGSVELGMPEIEIAISLEPIQISAVDPNPGNHTQTPTGGHNA